MNGLSSAKLVKMTL